MVTAILFAFLSLGLILFLSYKIDRNMSTNTIILMGVVFSMFTTSIISIITVFSQEKVRTITFWTMGSLSNTNYINVLTILVAFAVCSLVLLCCSRELNAFAIGEENARHIGVNVKRVKLKRSLFHRNVGTVKLYLKKGLSMNYHLQWVPDCDKVYALILANMKKE